MEGVLERELLSIRLSRLAASEAGALVRRQFRVLSWGVDKSILLSSEKYNEWHVCKPITVW